MADFGSNFTEAFAATYGLGLKRKQVEGEEKRAAAQETRAQELHNAQMDEIKLKTLMRNRLGAAGNSLDNPADQTGLLTSDDYEAMKAPKTTPVSNVTMGGKQPAPSALPMTTAKPQVTDVGLPSQPAEAKPAAQPDYVPVMIGEKIMYAPSTRVKRMQGPELIRAQAAAIGSLDPVVGAQLTQSANAIEGQNLELNSKRYAQGVLNAARTAENDFDAGLGMLRDAYNQNMPDLGNVEFTRQKDGSIKVDNYVDTAAGRKLVSSRTLPAKDSKTGLTAKESLFSYAISLGSPEAYRQNILDSSTLATQELQRILSVKEDKRQDAQLGISRARLALDRQVAEDTRNGEKFNAPVIKEVVVGQTQDGLPIKKSLQIRSGKGGSMQQLVSVPEGDFYLPYGINWEGAYKEMRNFAAKKGYGMGVTDQGFYMQRRDGSKIFMNAADKDRYRFSK